MLVESGYWGGSVQGAKAEKATMRTIVVAGTCSGVGKTCIAVGLMAAYTRRGLRVQPFKIGPDFLDPIHHKAATGRNSYNLDGWMLSRDLNLACFQQRMGNTDIAIVEGVMGLYDGRDEKSDVGSTAEMAKLLSAPVLLVLDCWALARSAAAIIHGYTTFDPALKFAGVVFNKVGSPAHAAWLTEAVHTTEPGIKVLGGVPKTAGIQLPERDVGTHIPEDEDMPLDYIQQLADLVELHVNLDAVLESAAVCEPSNGSLVEMDLALTRGPPSPPPYAKHVRIGVARDSAFCFYYHANLDLLEEAGAELVFFSPLKDSLPPRLDALIFGGGHPELHLEQLTVNKPLLYAIRAFALAGGIVYGECGGLMYLSQGIEGADGQHFPMCGVFPFWTRIQQVMRIGYVTVTPRDDCVLFPANIGEIRGQVYHFSETFYLANNTITDCPKGLTMRIENERAVEELEGYMQGNAMASYVHLHFGSNPTVAPAFVERCRTNTTKAAAVAAASASAVAGAGPVAAAAAGAAAAAAVAEALGEQSLELIPCHSSVTITEFDPTAQYPTPQPLATRALMPPPQEVETGSQRRIFERVRSLSPSTFSDVMFEASSGPQEPGIRRCESFDLGRQSLVGNWAGEGDNVNNGRLVRSESEVWSKTGDHISGSSGLNLGHHRGNSFSDYLNHINYNNNQYDASRPTGHSNHRGSADAVRYSDDNHSHSSLTMVNGMGSGGHVQSHLKADVASGKLNIPSVVSPSKKLDLERPRNGQLTHNLISEGVDRARLINGRRFPQRIVSLLPSASEILMHIGAGDRLIGVTDLCNKPPGVRLNREVVCWSKIDTSSMSSKNVDFTMKALAAKKESPFRLDVSWLSKAKPDLIISQDACDHCDIHDCTLTSMLAKAGVVSKNYTKLVKLGPRTITGMLASIITIGEAVGLYAEACLFVDSLRARLRRVAAAVASKSRPRVLLLQGIDPLLLGGHWVYEMEAFAGGVDGLQKPGCPPERLHWQRLTAYAPEVLILAPLSSGLERCLAEVEILGRLPDFWSIPAVQSRQVFICEHSWFSTPGPRLVDAVELLAQILHPSTTSKSQLKGAVLKFALSPGQGCRPEELTQHFEAFQ